VCAGFGDRIVYDPVVMDQAITFIERVGFPVFVALFVLIRLEPLVREVLTTLKEMVITMRVFARLELDDSDEPDSIESEDDGVEGL